MLDRHPYEDLPPLPAFSLTSHDVSEGQAAPRWMLSALFGIEGGQDCSPHLSWSGFPEETKSFVVTCFDPDAPTPSGFWHWSLSNIPASVTELARGETANLPGVQHPHDAGGRDFLGCAPPAGHGKHRYIFCVTALDVDRLDVDQNTSAAAVNFQLYFHGLARAFLTVTHQEH